jgi:[histone H3]-dimethyl-L-lysine9 demethylase
MQYQCASRQDWSHKAQDFAPVSRFCPGEVEQLIIDVEADIEALPNISRPFAVSPSISAAMKRADSHGEVISIPRNELTNELFVHLWSRDDPYPIVVKPVPGQKLFQYPWTPEFFAKILGTTACNAQDCETGAIIPTSIAEFYGQFGQESDTRTVTRLKVIQSPCIALSI